MSDEAHPTPRTRAEAFKALAHETPDLSYGAKVLWHVIYHHADSKTGESFPGYRTFANEMGCHKASIEGWLAELKAAGWIAFKAAPSEGHKRGYRHVYLILDGQGEPFFKSGSVPENPNTANANVSRKIRTLKGKSKPPTFDKKTAHSVPENPNVTKQHSQRECVVKNKDAGLVSGYPCTVAPSVAGSAPLGAPAAPPAKRRINSFPDDDEPLPCDVISKPGGGQ